MGDLGFLYVGGAARVDGAAGPVMQLRCITDYQEALARAENAAERVSIRCMLVICTTWICAVPIIHTFVSCLSACPISACMDLYMDKRSALISVLVNATYPIMRSNDSLTACENHNTTFLTRPPLIGYPEKLPMLAAMGSRSS